MLIFLLLILPIFAACSNESGAQSLAEDRERNKGVEQKEESNDMEEGELQETENQRAVRKAVESYVGMIQQEDYEAAYQRLSEVYKNAGITVEDLKQDFTRSEVDFSRYEVEYFTGRERSPKETSETNVEEEFMLARVFFKSTSQTREDLEEFPGSDVRWLDEKIWFHKENDQWKFYSIENQRGVTWKPDVYEAVIGFLESIKTKESNEIFSFFSDYYKENGYTAKDTKHFGIRQGDVIDYRILTITDELDMSMNFEEEISEKLVRVEVEYLKSDPDQLAGKELGYSQSWILHLEEGEWKIIALTPGDLRKSAIACYIENTCEELFGTNDDHQKEESSEGSETEGVSESTPSTEEKEEEELGVAADVMPLTKRDFNFMGIWVGMTLDEAQEILGPEIERAGEGGVEVYVYDGFSLYGAIGDQRFGIEFIEDTLVTERGISEGDSLQKLIATYGDDYEEENHYGIRTIHYSSEEYGASIRFTISEENEVSRITYDRLYGA